MNEGRYRLDDFELYRAARGLRGDIYRIINQLPAAEKYCLDPQMRRAIVSVTNNISEGHGRWHYQENIRFCQIARGSLEETIDDLNVCLDKAYADTRAIDELKERAYELGRRINGYIAYLRKSKQGERD